MAITKTQTVIFMGIGAICRTFFKWSQLLEQVGDIKIIALWDNNTLEYNSCLGGYTITHPQKNKSVDKIIIWPKEQYLTIKNQLIDDFNYNHELITNAEYIYRLIKNRIIDNHQNSSCPEMKKVLKYLYEQQYLLTYNYEFVEKYADYTAIDVKLDSNNGLYYHYWKNKKMYLSRQFDTVIKAQRYINALMIEQDVESPHYYRPHNNILSSSNTLIDAGAAEGFFALEYIDKVDKVFLIECDLGWLEALNETFRPYQDKVTIIDKKIGAYCDPETITLDAILNGSSFNILKLDVEGAEKDALLGAKSAFSKSNKFVAYICAYHKSEDEAFIDDFFTDNRYIVEKNGYMLFLADDTPKFELRRGVVTIVS